VVGAGSLGSAIGGTLALHGNDVLLVTHNAAHVSAINRNGLTLDDGIARVVVDVEAATACADVVPVDLLIVLVKSFDTTDAVVAARPAIGDHTVVLTLQNGVGCEDKIASVVGVERVISGRTFVGGRIVEPGIVEFGVEGRRTTIGELDGSITDRIVGIADLFGAAGLAVDISEDIVAMTWEKLFVNVATGALSALTGLPYGELSRHDEVAETAIAAVAEAMSVARALGVAVTTIDPAVSWQKAWEGLPYGFKASMLQSIEKGSRTEVDVMHGAVCDGGRQTGVATPVNSTLLAAVKGLELKLSLDENQSGESIDRMRNWPDGSGDR
jgi:2-dehydropantoate 2-reductase